MKPRYVLTPNRIVADQDRPSRASLKVRSEKSAGDRSSVAREGGYAGQDITLSLAISLEAIWSFR